MSGHRPARRLSWPVRAIGWYQTARAGRPSPCRFTPSCSSYAREAYELHGPWRGTLLTVRRLLRCRPFGPSGFDPVPIAAPPPSMRTAFVATSAPPRCDGSIGAGIGMEER